MTKAADLQKAINAALGEDLIKLGNDPDLEVEYLPTGILPIDILLEGGIPRGRFTECFGDFSTLKSYLGLCTIAQTQQADGTAALVDTEHAFDPEWAEELGVDVESLMVLHPPNGEKAVDATEALIRQQVDLVVWDSVAATLPRAEQEKSAQENMQPARLAALMSAAMRKLTAANSKTAILCINQTRVNVGIMFGNPESVPGGKALPFYASYRMAMRKGGRMTRNEKVWDGEKMKSSKTVTGIKIRATLEKSKLNAPHRETWFTFDLDTGSVDTVGYLLGMGLEHGFVIKEGKSKYRLKGAKKAVNGAQRFREWIEGDERRIERMEKMAWEAAGFET